MEKSWKINVEKERGGHPVKQTWAKLQSILMYEGEDVSSEEDEQPEVEMQSSTDDELSS